MMLPMVVEDVVAILTTPLKVLTAKIVEPLPLATLKAVVEEMFVNQAAKGEMPDNKVEPQKIHVQQIAGLAAAGGNVEPGVEWPTAWCQ